MLVFFNLIYLQGCASQKHNYVCIFNKLKGMIYYEIQPQKNRVIRASALDPENSYWMVRIVYDTDDGRPASIINTMIEEVYDWAMPYDKTYYKGNKFFSEKFFESEDDAIDYKSKCDKFIGRYLFASRRIRKRSIRASEFGRYQSFGNSGDPFADIEALKDAYIKEWWRDYDDPETGWDNIFYNALEDFKAYADDAASGFLIEQYENGEIGDGDMRYAFDKFTMRKDMIGMYDY